MPAKDWDESAHSRDNHGRFVAEGTIWYVDDKFTAHDRQHAAEQRAIEVAAETVRQWKADANEWRKTLGDRDAIYATKASVGATTDRVDKIERENIARDERERGEKANEVEDKRQTERRTARTLTLYGIGATVIAAISAIVVSLIVRGF